MWAVRGRLCLTGCWPARRGGKFLLRIEDTDLKRNTATAAAQVLKDLYWLGIDWDEGPDIGGPSAPYKQSERRDIYDRYIQQLLDEGKAYYCFDTSEELGALRDEAKTEKRHQQEKTEDNQQATQGVENDM